MPKLDLALELRPKSLDEVIGHDDIKPAIRNFINVECRHWLFSGHTGSGKTTLARIVGREIQGWDFSSEMEPEMHEVNAADYNGKDDIRYFGVQVAGYGPLFGKYKVIILDECHQLSKAAQVALLKYIEDDRTPTVWILCTTAIGNLEDPLIDRCTASFALEGMSKKQRRELVTRAVTHRNYRGNVADLLRALDEAEVKSARAVYVACEKFFAGMPARKVVGLS